jgi:hypothetical protein
MAKSYGVLCKKCGEHIHLADIEPEAQKRNHVLYAAAYTRSLRALWSYR